MMTEKQITETHKTIGEHIAIIGSDRRSAIEITASVLPQPDNRFEKFNKTDAVIHLATQSHPIEPLISPEIIEGKRYEENSQAIIIDENSFVTKHYSFFYHQYNPTEALTEAIKIANEKGWSSIAIPIDCISGSYQGDYDSAAQNLMEALTQFRENKDLQEETVLKEILLLVNGEVQQQKNIVGQLKDNFHKISSPELTDPIPS